MSASGIPPRSLRKATVGSLPSHSGPVRIYESSHELTYVASLDNIETGPISARETVRAWVVDNGIVKAKAILLGGNLVSITGKDNKEYIWLNKEGAVNYGVDANAFPLKRGLILHGGIRVAAVTAEHGLYYDTDWDISFQSDSASATITLQIQDTQANRDLLNDPLSGGQYIAPGSTQNMSLYPVTDAIFTYRITLRADEDFVRLQASLTNTRPTNIRSEIWLPQTYPVTEKSQVISHQQKRRVKDQWVQDTLITQTDSAGNKKVIYESHPQSEDSKRFYPAYYGRSGNIVDIPTNTPSDIKADLRAPLQWPTGLGGILYDYPYRNGPYHAVSYGDGRGAAYVSISNADQPHFTKMWSWGDPSYFDREYALAQNPPLAAGRPATEYYEPWGSAFNTGFFEIEEFTPGTHGWNAFVVPIESGLDNNKNAQQLQAVVDARVIPIVPLLESVPTF